MPVSGANITRYQVRIVTDDDREDQIGEVVPLAVFGRDFETALEAAATILRGHVVESNNDLKAFLDEWTSDAEFGDQFTAKSATWTERAFASCYVANPGEPVAWDT